METHETQPFSTWALTCSDVIKEGATNNDAARSDLQSADVRDSHAAPSLSHRSLHVPSDGDQYDYVVVETHVIIPVPPTPMLPGPDYRQADVLDSEDEPPSG